MYALCVSGTVNTQGFVWKFVYALYINFHSFIHSYTGKGERIACSDRFCFNQSILYFMSFHIEVILD